MRTYVCTCVYVTACVLEAQIHMSMICGIPVGSGVVIIGWRMHWLAGLEHCLKLPFRTKSVLVQCKWRVTANMFKCPGLVPYGIFSIMLQLCDIHWSGKITIVHQYNTYWNGTSTTVYQFKAHRSVMAIIVTALWIMRTFTNVEFKNVNATNDDQAATMFRNWFTSLLCLKNG